MYHHSDTQEYIHHLKQANKSLIWLKRLSYQNGKHLTEHNLRMKYYSYIHFLFFGVTLSTEDFISAYYICVV